ncbi:hypothetical protein BU204_06635 [Actinophytocola xanthii]|uniref:Uncharacterized protein n=1 Tax=Actinophytocola xanthii TaxID=1912961 RepID=A0A1Q8CV59_9PSEU|nr:hypothetical protein BU204_06635 [Actinophytocola xanthii]
MRRAEEALASAVRTADEIIADAVAEAAASTRATAEREAPVLAHSDEPPDLPQSILRDAW